MSIEVLADKGVSNREVARLLGVSEGTVRYHRRRQATGAVDGRRRQARKAAAWREAIECWLAGRGEAAPANVAELHAWLVAEHGDGGSLRSLQRYVREAWPAPPRRARRRVETPPGAQAQADWAVFPGVWVGGRRQDLLAFELKLSWSRYPAVVVWSDRKHALAWLAVHNEAFRRLGGIPACVRIDNERTAVVRGAGAWGTLHPAYRAYARMVRFHVDACPPRAPQAKGKVERRIRDHRSALDPYGCHWASLAELQTATDARVRRLSRRRRSRPRAPTSRRPGGASCGISPRCPCCRSPSTWPSSGGWGPTAWSPSSTGSTRSRSGSSASGSRSAAVPAPCRSWPRAAWWRATPAIPGAGSSSTRPITRGPRRPRSRPRPRWAAWGRGREQIAALAPEQRPLDLYAALAEVAR